MLFNKKKSTIKPNLPKEYVWELEIEEEIKEFKCVVTETEVITYQDGQEHKHLKITDPTCMEGVLQIDTQTRIYGDLVDFQLERFIPYIRLEGRWTMSDTTEEDRIQEQIKIYNRQSAFEIAVGVICLAATGIKTYVSGMDDWWMLSIFGVFFITAGAMQAIRVRQELAARKEAMQTILENRAKRKAEKEALNAASGNEEA